MWNIVHTPTQEVLICDECGVKFGSGRTLNRHKTYQHASYKLICPECDYVTTQKDNMRRHLTNTYKLKKVGTIIDKLQRIQTEQRRMPKSGRKPHLVHLTPTITTTNFKNSREKVPTPTKTLKHFPRTRKSMHGP